VISSPAIIERQHPVDSIGYVVHVKTPGTSGGETRSYQIAQALGQAGAHIHLYGQVDPAFGWMPRIAAHRLWQPLPLGLVQLLRDFRRNRVQVAIERYQFPLFNPGFFVQMLRRRPIVLEVHGFPIEEFELQACRRDLPVSLLVQLITRLPRGAWERLQRAIFRRVAHFIVTSAGTREILVGLGVPPARVSVVYNCVDPVRFDPAGRDLLACRQDLGLPAAGRIVLYAGSLFHEELATIIAAARRVVAEQPDVYFVCTGFGPLDQLAAQARAAGLPESRFQTMPAVSHEYMPDLLTAADVVLAPYSLQSARFKKAFHYSPLKVMEALAMRKAIVTVDAAELRTTFESVVNVQFVTSGSPDSWAGGIARALALRESPDLAQGRAFVMNGYRWADAAQKYLAIIRQVEQARR
jgi:glycosyltransferase involved in cell wall biosynthesis